MLDEVRVVEVEPRALAVVRRRASFDELPAVLTDALDQVSAFLRQQRIPTGLNVVLYHDQVMNLEAGVEVFAPLPSHPEIVAASTPGGRAAKVSYWGPYEQVSLAHTAIVRQCVAARLPLEGRYWEVYGEWAEDPEQRRTDVFYLLRDA